MKMSDVYMKMEQELHENESVLKEADEKIIEYLAKAEEAEAQMRKWQAAAEKVEADNERVRSNVIALKEAIAALQKCDFTPTEEELKEEKKEQAKKEELAKIKPFNPVKSWSRRKGEIGQFKPNGELVNRWTSQRSAGISLRWSQTGVSHFMKLDRDTQIRRKGWYLEYMG